MNQETNQEATAVLQVGEDGGLGMWEAQVRLDRIMGPGTPGNLLLRKSPQVAIESCPILK